MLKFFSIFRKKVDEDPDTAGDDAVAENPLNAVLRQKKATPPKPTKQPPSNREPFELVDEPDLEVDGESDGCDPYNTTGGFDRRAAWKRVTKR